MHRLFAIKNHLQGKYRNSGLGVECFFWECSFFGFKWGGFLQLCKEIEKKHRRVSIGEL